MNTVLSCANFRRTLSLAGLASLIAAMLVVAMASVAGAQQSFPTVDEAVNALVGAVRIGNRSGILTLLGREGAAIVSSGDEAGDAAERQRFLAAYDAKHRTNIDGGKAILILGDEDFPFPIPLVRKDGMWRFDTVAGRQEILYRRIGRNELEAIQVCLAYVDAQNEYAERITPARVPASMRSGSLVRPAPRTGSTGRLRKAMRQVPSVNCSPRQVRRVIVLAAGVLLSMVIITRYSRNRDRPRLAVHWITS